VASLQSWNLFPNDLIDELASHAQDVLDNSLCVYRIEGRAAHGGLGSSELTGTDHFCKCK